MLLPTKHEKIENNLLVVGAEILRYLKQGPSNIEEIYQYLKPIKKIAIDLFYDTLVFLWVMDFVTFDDDYFVLNLPLNKDFDVFK